MADDSALERFRENTGKPGNRPKVPGFRPPVPSREIILVANTLIWFAITLFWYRGGLDLVGHWMSAGMGIWTFLCLFLPVGFGTDRPDTTPRAHLKRLLKFPVFWFGLCVLGYGLVQILNFGYVLQIIPERGGRMVEVYHLDWLPAGISVPMDFTNSPRAGMLQLALPWLMVCSLVVGIRSRRALDGLINGALAILFFWTVMALGYYYTGATEIYWGIDMGKNNIPWFWGTIKDPNHGAILQVFGLLICLALAGRGFRRSLAVGRIGGVQLFYLALALFFSLATLQSLSRAGIAFVVLIWLAGFIGFGAMAYMNRSLGLVSICSCFIVLLVLGGIVFIAINLNDGQGRANDLAMTLRSTVDEVKVVEADETTDVRIVLNRVSFRLLKTSPVFGYGVGSWSYLYRRHADPLRDWDILVTERLARDANGWSLKRDGESYKILVPLHFDHAHNEYLQYLCEFGVVGAAGVFLLVIWIPGMLIFGWKRSGFIGLAALGATGVILLHSLIEFPTRTPALGLLFALLLAAGAIDRNFRREGGAA